jgi:hypothetical protein
MATTPAGMVDYIQRHRNETMVLQQLYYLHSWRNKKYSQLMPYAEVLMLCDRLDSLGCSATTHGRLDEYSVKFLSDKNNFKLYAKALKDNPEMSVREFAEETKEREFYAKLNIAVDDYYTAEMLEFLYNEIYDTNYHDTFGDNMSVYRLMAYYLSRGLWVFGCENPAFRYRHGTSIGALLYDFFEKSQYIGYEPQKEDFFKQYIAVKKHYKAHKKEYDNKKIQNQYAKYPQAWKFETDDLFIYVPSTSDEFEDEATQQGNCVYSMYLEKVLRGDTNVVFIRKKSEPHKSHITCEVSNSGKIKQFYFAHNRGVYPVENETEYNFYKEYTKYLNSIWQ